MSVPLKFFEISKLVKICRKILILATIFENLDFCQNVLKSSRFLSKFLIISYLVQIPDNLDFVLFEKSRFPWNFSKILIKTVQNLDFGQPLSKIFICVKLRKISILVKIFENISILVEMLQNLKFGQIFGKISTLEKISIVVKFSEISILVKIFGKPQMNESFENLDLVQNIQKSGF